MSHSHATRLRLLMNFHFAMSALSVKPYGISNPREIVASTVTFIRQKNNRMGLIHRVERPLFTLCLLESSLHGLSSKNSNGSGWESLPHRTSIKIIEVSTLVIARMRKNIICWPFRSDTSFEEKQESEQLGIYRK